MAGIVSSRLKVGLEVHVELATRTKMFSRVASVAHASNYEAGPNSLVDPLTLALPGSLPVLNIAAIEMAMMVGLALGCRVNSPTRWDRKSYFYPDMPKNYQISQYDRPLCEDGRVEWGDGDGSAGGSGPGGAGGVGIIRAHLEEDAGKLLHEAPGGGAIDFSIVDLNRAGTPLLEIVTAPDFTTAEQVVSFAQQLRGLCRFLGVTEGVMQRGHMRFEPNINCVLTLDDGWEAATPVVEIKNLNSFKSLKGAIEYEQREQPRRFLEDGKVMGPGAKTTRGWDDTRLVTFVQREKEDAHDYRYFPDPDLLPLVVDAAWVERVRARLGELPRDKGARYQREFGLSAGEAASITDERTVCEFYEAVVAGAERRGVERARAGRAAANFVLQSGLKRANERGVLVSDLGASAEQVAGVVALREAGSVSANAADELFGLLCTPEGAGRSAEEVAAERGMLIVRDDAAMARWIERAIAEQPQAAADVRAGKVQAIGRLVGAVMKQAGSAADAKTVREALLAKLSG
ncbi:MAG: Asp-tRNA(Asn)/Glu-tRNA(Gln) amidotransferase subunit GatB [Phycisphaeraceae bacterium]|nr:Asp-tRNA(Asn)/Glu-tRNA(Gln) amidotransferase subunit GatB [Phycisphaeraceae bacterium]